ncbi:MAG: trimethylamine methyltransferase family protein [Bacillota bacterium]|jgi:trimethylamine--corrinoid protein Co-methyltransferase
MGLASKRIEVLSSNELNMVHDATMKILEETGVVFNSEESLEIFKKNGVRVEGQTVFFSKEIVEKALETTPSNFKHSARNKANSIFIGFQQKQLAVSATYGPVFVQDLDNGRRRGTIEDYINITKLCHASDLVNVIGGIPVDVCDVDPRTKKLQMIYNTLKHTDKAVYGVTATQEEIQEMFDLVEIAFGETESLWNRYVIAVPVCPLSPLKYDWQACESMLAYAKRRQPIYINSCIMAGVTGPINLIGTAVQMNAEILAGLVLIQLINPGTPVVYVPGSTAANMLTGSYSTGSPEANLINIAGLQLALDLYHLPTRVMAGLTDAKVVDYQSGVETMQNYIMLMLAGVHFLHEGLGCLDNIMTVSYEKFILDQEVIKRVARIMEGLSVNEKTLSVDVIQDVGHSGQYLMHANTLEDCRKRWRPEVSCWDSYEAWKASGAEDVVKRANRKYKGILENAPESLLDPEVDKELRTYIEKVK